MFFGGVPGGVAQLLLRALDGGREGALGNGPNATIAHVGNFIRVLHHDLKGLILGQIIELVQHVLGGAVIEGRLIVSVLKTVARLQHRPVNGVLRVLEMHVTGGHHRFVQRLAQLDDGAVEILYLLDGIHQVLPQHILVVAQRLHFQKIVVIGNTAQLLKAAALHHSSVKFTRFTGRTNDKPLAVFVQHTAGHPGLLEEILGVGLTDDFVKVFQAQLIAHQDDEMIILFLDDRRVAAAQAGVDLLHILDPFEGQVFQHFAEDFRQRHGVVRRAMVIEGFDLQVVVDGIQFVIAQAMVKVLGQRQRVDVGILQPQAGLFRRRPHKAHIKVVGVVSDEHPVARELHELLDGFVRAGRVGHHGIVYAGKLHDFGRDGFAGVHEGVEGLRYLAVLHQHRADLGESLRLGVKAGGLGVVNHKAAGERAGGFTVDHRHHVIHKICLTAIDELEIRVVFADGLGGKHCFREALTHAMVGDGDGPVPHAVGGAHDLAGVAETVHAGKLGVQVQLHPLFGGVVLPLFALHLQHVIRIDHIVVLVFIVGTLAFEHEGSPLFHFFPLGVVFAVAAAQLQTDGAGVVGDGHDIALLEVALDLHGKHVAPDGDLAAVAAQVLEGGDLPGLEVLAVEHAHRLVGEVQARDLEVRRLLFLLKTRSGGLLQHPLLPLVSGHSAVLFQGHGRQHAGALLHQFGQDVSKADPFQNVFSHRHCDGELCALQRESRMVQKAVHRQALAAQLVDHCPQALFGDGLKGKIVAHHQLQAFKLRRQRRAKPPAQLGRQRHGAAQADFQFSADTQQFHLLHQDPRKTAGKGLVGIELRPQLAYQWLQ